MSDKPVYLLANGASMICHDGRGPSETESRWWEITATCTTCGEPWKSDVQLTRAEAETHSIEILVCLRCQ